MHSLKDLEDTLGQSYEQIRRRVNELSSRFDGITETGKRNKTLVTDSGLALLQRLKELEARGYSVDSAIEEMQEEISKNGSEGEKATTEVREESTKQALNILNEEIEFLRDQLRQKDRQLQEKNDHIKRLIPGKTTTEAEPHSNGSKSLWMHFKEWLNSPMA